MLFKTSFLLLSLLLVVAALIDDADHWVHKDDSMTMHHADEHGNLITDAEGDPITDPSHSWYGWTGILHFDEGVDLSHSQLAAIAEKAYDDMKQDVRVDKSLSKKDRPKVMTALAFGNKVYLGSSIKGGVGNSYVYIQHATIRDDIQEIIQDHLNQCRVRGHEGDGEEGEEADEGEVGIPHKNGAACGEISALYQLFLEHEGIDLRPQLKGSKVVAWNGDRREGVVVDPCGGPGGWGCNVVVGQLHLDAGPSDTTTDDNIPRYTIKEPRPLFVCRTRQPRNIQLENRGV